MSVLQVTDSSQCDKRCCTVMSAIRRGRDGERFLKPFHVEGENGKITRGMNIKASINTVP